MFRKIVLSFVFITVCFYGVTLAQEIVSDIKDVDMVVPVRDIDNEKVLFRSINWIADNIDSTSGWSLTGFSKMGLDDDFIPWFLKFGIIGGRMGMENEYNIRSNESWQHFEDWEFHRYYENVVFGIHFYKEIGSSKVVEKIDLKELLKDDDKRMFDLAEYYYHLGVDHMRGVSFKNKKMINLGIREYTSAMFMYFEIINKFPNSEFIKIAKERTKKIKNQKLFFGF